MAENELKKDFWSRTMVDKIFNRIVIKLEWQETTKVHSAG